MEQTQFVYKASAEKSFMSRTYGWMFLALAISAASAYFASNSMELMRFLWGSNALGFKVLCGVELILVAVISTALRKLPLWGTVFCMVLYSVLNGLTLSSIFCIYMASSIAHTFIAAALMFGIMCIYGSVTRRNLAYVGYYCMMALIGLVIVSIGNFIIGKITHNPLPMIDWIISLVTILIFTGLTAYDSQKIASFSKTASDSDDYRKLAIYAALSLYLDFINIFLSLLRLFGRRK